MNVLKYLTPESLLILANNMIQDKTDPSGKSINDLLVEIFTPSNLGSKWVEFAKILLKDVRVDQNKTCDFVMESASRCGYIDIAEFLLYNNKLSIELLKCHFLSIAIGKGHVDIVKLLLNDKRVDPTAIKNYAIRNASCHGHIDIVKLLLQYKRVNPSDCDNDAICCASDMDHFDIVKLLLNDERTDLSKCDFLPQSHDNKMKLIKILFENKQWLSKIDDKKLITTLLNTGDDKDREIASFLVKQINSTHLIDKTVIDVANKSDQNPRNKIIDIANIVDMMKVAGITNIRIKIGITETKITEVVNKDGKDMLITTHIK